jgi:hypothetical protein
MPLNKAKSTRPLPKRTQAVSRKGGKGSGIVQLRRQYQPVPQATRSSRSRTSAMMTEHIAFFPLLFLVFIIWCVYRRLFQYPVWFDETIGKAIFFGLPVFLYASLTRSKSIVDTVDPKYVQPGLWLGLAVGGIFGFAGALASLIKSGVIIQAAPLFILDSFWWEFTLALFTGFWESLFFFSWIMIVIMEKFKNWPFLNQSLLTAVIFLAFHVPNTLLRFPLQHVAPQLALLFFFGLGQALIFTRAKNIYTLTLSHAIWGMVLLIHTR